MDLVELHLASLEGEQRPVAADPDVLTRVQFAAALADDDGAGGNRFSAKCLDAKSLRLALATVAG